MNTIPSPFTHGNHITACNHSSYSVSDVVKRHERGYLQEIVILKRQDKTHSQQILSFIISFCHIPTYRSEPWTRRTRWCRCLWPGITLHRQVRTSYLHSNLTVLSTTKILSTWFEFWVFKHCKQYDLDQKLQTLYFILFLACWKGCFLAKTAYGRDLSEKHLSSVLCSKQGNYTRYMSQ